MKNNNNNIIITASSFLKKNIYRNVVYNIFNPSINIFCFVLFCFVSVLLLLLPPRYLFFPIIILFKFFDYDIIVLSIFNIYNINTFN